MMSEAPIIAEPSAILKDLEYMTTRWHELSEPAALEVRAFKENMQPQIGKFSPDDLSEAVDWIESFNESGYNIYAVRNPVRTTIGKAASDDDIIASFFVWADCDEGTSANNVKQWSGPAYSAAVLTGTIPDTRVHLYWQLQEPCKDLAAWRNTQMAIAAHFGSDKSVINPSRIMRVGGTVAYPAKHKQERGYVKELTVINTQYEEPRKPVTIDQMTRAFGASPGASAPMQIDTGQFDVMDRERAAIQAMSGQDWNNAVLRLVGSYVRKGLSDTEIHALTDPLTLGGYTVQDTRAEVQDIINRTRNNPKFEGAGQDEPQKVEVTPQTIVDFKIDSSEDFVSDMEPLEYLIDGILPRGVVYSLTGHAGHGKTTLALQFALSVATGSDFHDKATSAGQVLILAGENPYNVKWQYAAALAARNMEAKEADIHFVQGRFSIEEWTDVLQAKMQAMPNLKLVIVDSLQAFFEGDNDNDNSQMVTMAHKMRQMVKIPTRPALVVIAHPAGKVASKDNLVPRGGGAFLNEIDGNLTVWSQDSSQQSLHHSQKFRGAGFDPLEWVMQLHEFDHLCDIHGTPLKLPVSRPEMIIEKANRENANDRLLTRYLETVSAGKPLSVRELSSQEAVSRYRAEQIIATARDEKLIRRHAKSYVITDGGKDFLEAENVGL